MEIYNFDKIIDRHGSYAIKCDGLNAKFGREDLEPLWIADMDFEVCPAISKAMIKRMQHPVYGYAYAPDSYWESIMKWLNRRHNWNVKREELTFIPGVVRGVAYAVNYFTKPGDKIIIQPPVYHPFKMVIEGNDRIAVNNPLIFEDNNYKMDIEWLKKLLDVEEAKRPKMLILCNPHNPAGIQWNEDTLKQLAIVSSQYNIKVVSDEIHGDLMLYGRRHIPFATVNKEAEKVAITLGAPSKTFNIPGMVSSWMVINNPELRTPFYKWLEANEFSSPTFMATLATEAAYCNGEEWLNQMLKYIEGNIAAVEEYLANNIPAIKAIRPEASFLIWLDCHELGLSQDQLVDLFVDKAHLALNDGEMFGKEGIGFMRLNVASPRSIIINALKHLHEAINKM